MRGPRWNFASCCVVVVFVVVFVDFRRVHCVYGYLRKTYVCVCI
jgi:hypothetical protein